MLGAFIMHPKTAYTPPVDKDFVMLLQEYAVLPNNTVPNTMNMEFNWLVFNGKTGPATTPLVVRLGDRVRIRTINLGMDHHPIHLHGHVPYDRNRGRPDSGGRVDSGEYRAGWRSSIERRGICREQPWGLDAALSSAASHDEPDVFERGADVA